MAGTFEIFKDNAGEFRFRLRAGNGDVVLYHQNYESAAARDNGMEAVGRAALDARINDLTA